MATTTRPAHRVVLLFCHGGGFTKEIWRPIYQWMREAPVLRQIPHEVHAFDWRYHGEKSDLRDPGQLTHLPHDVHATRVEHPARHWTEWGPGDILAEIQQLRALDNRHTGGAHQRTRIIGIAHSMGATAMLKLEKLHPGTLDGLIAFEPVWNVPAGNKDGISEMVPTMMVKNTLLREHTWETWDQVLEHFTTGKAYRKWHKDLLTAFLEHGVRRAADNSGYYLAMPPMQEASLYCHEVQQFSVEDFRRIQCNVCFEYSERTPLFQPKMAKFAMASVAGQYSVGEPIPDAGHNMIMENPEECVKRIVSNLERFPAMFGL